MRYQVYLEHQRDTDHWTATVAGIPEIIVDASSENEAIRMIEEALRMARAEGIAGMDPLGVPVEARLVRVDV